MENRTGQISGARKSFQTSRGTIKVPGKHSEIKDSRDDSNADRCSAIKIRVKEYLHSGIVEVEQCGSSKFASLCNKFDG